MYLDNLIRLYTFGKIPYNKYMLMEKESEKRV